MPVMFNTANGASIFLDRISEVTANMPTEKLECYPEGYSENRKHQLAASDLILEEQFQIKGRVQRNERGAPSVRDAFLSISHTGDHIGIIVHRGQHVAIDIEVKTRNVSSIVSRFTTAHELELARTCFKDFPEVFLWSCKECLFKYLRLEGVLFKEHLQLIEFHGGEAAQSIWNVSHPKFEGQLLVNSAIFGALMVSYMDSSNAMHE